MPAILASSLQAHIEARAAAEGLDARAVAHVLADMRRARIDLTSTATAYHSIADRSISRLSAQIQARRLAESQRAAEAQAALSAAPRIGATNDESILAKRDPKTGETLETVYLVGGRRAYYNAHSRVCYPIPDTTQPTAVAGVA